MGQRELLVKRGGMGGETVSSMGGGKGDGGLAFWMLEVGRWGRGRGVEGKTAFIEHRSGFWKCVLRSCTGSVTLYDLA